MPRDAHYLAKAYRACDWSRAVKKKCSRTMRESTVSTPMFASYLQTVEEVTAVLAGCSYCETWSPRRAARAEQSALFSLDSDGITNQRRRGAERREALE